MHTDCGITQGGVPSVTMDDHISAGEGMDVAIPTFAPDGRPVDVRVEVDPQRIPGLLLSITVLPAGRHVGRDEHAVLSVTDVRELRNALDLALQHLPAAPDNDVDGGRPDMSTKPEG